LPDSRHFKIKNWNYLNSLHAGKAKKEGVWVLPNKTH
jgi:hypothetical protein